MTEKEMFSFIKMDNSLLINPTIKNNPIKNNTKEMLMMEIKFELKKETGNTFLFSAIISLLLIYNDLERMEYLFPQFHHKRTNILRNYIDDYGYLTKQKEVKTILMWADIPSAPNRYASLGVIQIEHCVFWRVGIRDGGAEGVVYRKVKGTLAILAEVSFSGSLPLLNTTAITAKAKVPFTLGGFRGRGLWLSS
ncbi:MAG: hypothetical protein LBT78_12100 [Tannerella sp.]|jgi:hypothetical protein|nr:hypothetical protein [Tannerella sp.]